MKLIIEVEKEYYEMIKYNVEHGQEYKPFEIIANGIPYEPKGDCISRETLKEAISKVVAEERKEDPMWANGLRYALTIINDAPPVEYSLLPLASEADNAYMRGYEVGKAEGIMKASTRPKGEQIAWEQGYEAGLAQGKHEQTAEWRDNLIEVFRESAEIGGDVFHLSEVERIINGEPI